MLSDAMPVITTVVIAHFLALISPGPDFLLVVRSALRNTRRRAVGVAFGIALANAIYITLCIIGVGSIIAHSLWLMITLKILGGCFLLYIAYHALKARRSDYAFLNRVSSATENDKRISFWKEFVLGVWMVLLIFVWDAMIIFILSQQKVRNTFSKIAFYIDKIAGALLGFMGYKLVESAVKETV